MLIIIQEIFIKQNKCMKKLWNIIGRLFNIFRLILQHLLIWLFAMRDQRIILKLIVILRGRKKFYQLIIIIFQKAIKLLSMILSIDLRNKVKNGENPENYQKTKRSNLISLSRDILRKQGSSTWEEICLLSAMRQL